MTQHAKTCDPTPIDWGNAKLKNVKGKKELQFSCDETACAALYHHGLTAANLVQDASQRVVNPVNRAVLGKALSNTAFQYVMATFDRIKPQDPFEEMLIAQTLATHSRMMYLSRIMLDITEIEVIQRISEAADRAANTFRRQMLALREYRRPTKTVHFIRQSNVAGQQIVSNSFSESGNSTNEQGFNHEQLHQQHQAPTNHQPGPTALPTDEGRVDPLAGVSRKGETVDTQHGTEDRGRKKQVKDERPETR